MAFALINAGAIIIAFLIGLWVSAAMAGKRLDRYEAIIDRLALYTKQRHGTPQYVLDDVIAGKGRHAP